MPYKPSISLTLHIQTLFKIGTVNLHNEININRRRKECTIPIRKYLTDKDFVCEWANNTKDAIDKISINNYG